MAEFISTVDAPTLFDATPTSLTVQWGNIPGAEAYSVEILKVGVNSSDSSDWICLTQKLQGTFVRKKNLLPSTSYRFRVRGRKSADNSWISDWSVPSPVFSTKGGIHQCFRSILGDTVTNAKEEILDLNNLGDGLVALYFSASWCPPCRQFTPLLAKFYAEVKAAKKKFEVVFVSADHDEPSFDAYLKGHHGPWLAIPYNATSRTNTSNYFKVEGIPRLIIFAPDGRIVEGNARSLNMADFARWESRQKS